MTGRALRDSVRIATKFSEMEKNYSSRNSLRFVADTSCKQYLGKNLKHMFLLPFIISSGCSVRSSLLNLLVIPVMMLSLMWYLRSNGFLRRVTKI